MKTPKFRLLQHKRILIKALALATRNGGAASPEQRLSTAGHPAPRRRNIQLHNMRFRLQNYPIDVLCPDDLNLHIEVEENGSTAVENALIKASAYYEAVQLPTIAGDSGVTLAGVAEEDQPGLLVRRVNGKVLTDDEMIDHYAGLAKTAGKLCTLQYVTGIALITAEGVKTMELLDRPLQLCAEPNQDRNHNGNPLDVVTKTIDGRYFNDLIDTDRTEYEKQGEQQFTEFVVSNLLC